VVMTVESICCMMIADATMTATSFGFVSGDMWRDGDPCSAENIVMPAQRRHIKAAAQGAADKTSLLSGMWIDFSVGCGRCAKHGAHPIWHAGRHLVRQADPQRLL
jgi:hypothetical protein